MAPLKTSMVPSYDQTIKKVNEYLINEYQISSVIGLLKEGLNDVQLFLQNKSVSNCLDFLWLLDVLEGFERSGRLIGKMSSYFRPVPK